MIDFWYPLDSKELVIVVILFIRVIPVEVGHDDGDGEGDDEDADDGAEQHLTSALAAAHDSVRNRMPYGRQR